MSFIPKSSEFMPKTRVTFGKTTYSMEDRVEGHKSEAGKKSKIY